jgi:DNA-binding NarL/FixJ family response regulator
MDVIQVVIVDDHQIIRDGIEAMLLTSKNIKIVGEASDYNGLMQIMEKQTPDVIILDIALPGKSGLEIAKELKEMKKRIKILILSGNSSEENIIESIKAGACGFLPKDTSKEEFIEAINRVYNNEEYFGSGLSKTIFRSYVHHVKTHHDSEPGTGLSEREIEIIKLLSDGLSSKEIGDKLFISSRTVESHKANILSKLNLKNCAEMIKYSIKQGIIKL